MLTIILVCMRINNWSIVKNILGIWDSQNDFLFCPFSFGHCVFFSSSIDGFWLPPFGIIKLFVHLKFICLIYDFWEIFYINVKIWMSLKYIYRQYSESNFIGSMTWHWNKLQCQFWSRFKKKKITENHEVILHCLWEEIMI